MIEQDDENASPAARETRADFPHGSVVQLVSGDAMTADAVVVPLHEAVVSIGDVHISASDGDIGWSWLISDLEAVIHGAEEPWTIFIVPGIADFGVSVGPESVPEFRRALDDIGGIEVLHQHGAAAPAFGPPDAGSEPVSPAAPISLEPIEVPAISIAVNETVRVLIDEGADPKAVDDPTDEVAIVPTSIEEQISGSLAGLEAREISAWFGTHQVLDRVSLNMRAGEVTALIGPSGCGKSTFLRILNRMHEMIPSAALAGEVLLDGHDVYDPGRKLTDARREIGMVFQKPNPFPAMSIYDNVVASLRLTGTKASTSEKDDIVETCLGKAGLWNEVRDRLRQPGGGLSGGQQQRLCIARALAIRPRVLLMDEPCSALDPTSTRRIEQTITELASEVTIVIVTHNMQQAARVSKRCAFFLAEHGTPGVIVEHGPTPAMFGAPQDPRTDDYVNGRFG